MPRGRAGAWSAWYKPSSTIYIKYLLQTSFHEAVLSLLKVLSLMVYCSEKANRKIWDPCKEKTKLSKTDKSIQMCSSDPKCVFWTDAQCKMMKLFVSPRVWVDVSVQHLLAFSKRSRIWRRWTDMKPLSKVGVNWVNPSAVSWRVCEESAVSVRSSQQSVRTCQIQMMKDLKLL